jgi:subtilisin family serine protease
MNALRRAVLLTVAIATLTLAGSAAAAAPAPASGSYVPGEILVRFKPSLPGDEVRSLLARDDAGVEQALPAVPGLRLVDLPPGTSVGEAESQLEGRPEVLYAEPNWRRQMFAVPNDPRFGEQWSLQNTGQAVFGTHGLAGADIRAPAAWNIQTGSKAVPVAIVDTGISFSHPDLAANIWTNSGEIPGNGIDDDGNGFKDDIHGWDFGDNDNYPSDTLDADQGHGTAMAGIIGAVGNNGTGIAGINWNASLMPLRVPLTVAGEVAAFNYAKNNGAKVVNYSAGSSQYSSSELAAINGAPNVLFVVAAGNERINVDADPIYPCAYPASNVICVASTDQRDRLSTFSNFGPTSVDLAAPGETILTTYPPGGVAASLRDSFGDLPLSSRWTSGGHGRRWRLTRRLHRGLSIADSPHGRYKNHSNSWIRSQAIDLSQRKACSLEFFIKVRTQRRHDRLVVEASSGGRRFVNLHHYSGSRRGDRFLYLPARFNGHSAVYLRFRLKTDGSVRKDGAYVDNVELDCEASTNTYAFLDGTSFSAPEVTGAAGLVLAEHPAYSVAKVRAALLDHVDELPGLSGKVVSDGRLNVAAAVAP